MSVGEGIHAMAQRIKSVLTPTQLEIMQLVWDRGELSVAQVWKLLAGRRSVARNTVQTMLTRLADKGWLLVRAEGKAFYFRASRPRKSTVRGIMSQLIDTVFDGSAGRLVMTLLDDRRIPADELRRIRERIERAERRER
jgi:predicted transcriptional regulator